MTRSQDMRRSAPDTSNQLPSGGCGIYAAAFQGRRCDLAPLPGPGWSPVGQLQMSRSMLSTTRAEAVQLHRQFSHVGQVLADCVLPLDGADNEQEAATAGASQLGARRACVKCAADCNVDLVVGHSRRQLPLRLPALAHRPTAPTRNCAHPASARTPSSRRGEFSGSSAAAPGAPVGSPRPSTYCRSAGHNQDGKGSL